MDSVNWNTFHDTKQARPPLPPRSPARPRQNSIRTSLAFHIDDLMQIFSTTHTQGASKFDRAGPRLPSRYEFNKVTKAVERQDFSHSLPTSPTRAHWVTSKRTRPGQEFRKSFLRYSHPVQPTPISKINRYNPCFNKDQYSSKRFVGILTPGRTPLPPPGYHNTERDYSSDGPTSASNPCGTTYLRDPFSTCNGTQQYQVSANNPERLTVDHVTKSYFDTSSDDLVTTSWRVCQSKWARKARKALSWLKEAFSLSKEEKELFQALRSMRYKYRLLSSQTPIVIPSEWERPDEPKKYIDSQRFTYAESGKISATKQHTLQHLNRIHCTYLP
ncbi:hypothetical protein EDB81DRAFT_767965 [Dactylonectria macrodidyma]|uniref:Uncharacterized protein n=1 Tax=Dactylonectria macrodidyma TaxID=307937 RepID=A0A9P9IA90_9HYPO|nr:hypothetical protein EDB81DRAFT_767965 [Dactylonectria macrodidyma]